MPMHNRTVTTGPTNQSSGLLAAVLEGAGVGVVVFDALGHIVIANTLFCDLLGYAKDELLRLDEKNITIDGADAALFQDLLAGRRTRYAIDKRYLHKSGAEVWGRVTVTMVRESARDFAVAVVEDVTEKRGIEEAADEVRKAHERYALVARATNDVIWDWDAEHGTIVWNDALQTMFGYAPDQIDNRLQWWDSHLHPDDRERVVAGINGIIEKGGSSWTDEYRFERADGSFTEVLDRGYIARSEDGTPIRMIGAMLDVTERKRAERTASFMAEASAVLASSLDYHVTLARVAELAVPLLADCCFVDLRTGEGAFDRLASAIEDPARDFFAGLVREVITSGVPRLLAHIEQASGVCSALIVPLVVVSGDRPMGALTLAMTHSRRVLAERDTRVVEDVARRAAMAIEHARLYDDAQKANLAKDEFLAILSHELSTPLTIILGWSGILSRDDVTQEEMTRGVESIRAGALAQAQLIDDVLDLSRVTTGKLRLEVQPVSIGQLVADSLTAVRVAAAAKRIELITPDTATAATVLGDANRLRQVIWNLLTNAIKFTPPGGRVVVDLEITSGTVRLIVTDTGRGIAREFLTHVFEPFRQADASTTRVHGGLGLGLAIVRYLVEGHGGTVAAFSDGLDRGARFVVELPSVPTSASFVSATRSKSNTELAGVRVLFVDDQADARELAEVIFSGAGAETTIASSATEALGALERLPIDIIVADIGMPEVDGYGLIAEIRRRDAVAGRHTPAIAATAYRGQEDRNRVLAAGFDAYLKKPMDAATLTSTVAGVIAAARSSA